MQNIALNNVSIVADINQIAIRVSSTLKICRKSGRKYRNYGSSNIHSIRTTLNKSIQYTVDGNKTRNGKLVVAVAAQLMHEQRQSSSPKSEPAEVEKVPF